MARILGILFVIAGTLALAYGGFSYTRASHDVKLGSIQFSVKEKESVTIPAWGGVAGITTGVLLLLLGGRKK